MSESIFEHMSATYNNWQLPDIAIEMGEIERTARSLSTENPTLMLNQLVKSLKAGEPTDFNEELWARLENSDSWDIRMGHMEDVKYHTDESGRNADVLAGALTNDAPMFMPIIVIKEDGTPYLISGNTRLMVARALGIIPKVFIAHMGNITDVDI